MLSTYKKLAISDLGMVPLTYKRLPASDHPCIPASSIQGKLRELGMRMTLPLAAQLE